MFHEKLGTVADKVERVAKLAEWLATEGIVPNCDPKQARRAAELAKADLVTGMVGEFPELQGLMGGYYAAAQGEDAAVAEAVRDHYKPVGQGDDVPTAPVTVAVSLADKLDTIVSFFAAGLRPSGSKDPYALRRSALGILATLTTNEIRLPLGPASLATLDVLRDQILDLPLPEDLEERQIRGALMAFSPAGESGAILKRLILGILDFFADRLKVQQREAGVRHDLIDAVFALGGEAVDEQREVDFLPLGADTLAVGLQRGELILEDHLAVIEQAPDQRGLAVVDRSAGDEAQQRLGLMLRQIGVDVGRDQRVGAIAGGHQKYPSCFFFSIDAA